MNATMDLVTAAARLRVPWHTAHRLVLTGQIQGERREGRWWVDPRSVDKFAVSSQDSGEVGEVR